MSLDGQLERLCALYDEKSDDELLEMYADREDLTEVAQEALAQTMRGRKLEGRVQSAEEKSYGQVEDDSRSIMLDRSEVVLWTFGDAFEAKEALRVLGEAGIWHRVADRSRVTGEGIKSRVLVGLTVVVQRADYDAAAELLEREMNLFPKMPGNDDLASPLTDMQGTVLVAMFERSEGLAAAEALGKVGISYRWRDGADEPQELPDAQTVAIEVRRDRLAEATKTVMTALAEREGFEMGPPQ